MDPAFGHSSDQVGEWLQRLPPDDGEIIATLRGVIRDVAPDAHEIVYHDALGYGPTDSGFDRILYISVFRDHINLGLFYGAGLHDPQALLTGSGKQMRHVKIRPGAPLPRAAIRQLLEKAWPAGLGRVRDRHVRKRQ